MRGDINMNKINGFYNNIMRMHCCNMIYSDIIGMDFRMCCI